MPTVAPRSDSLAHNVVRFARLLPIVDGQASLRAVAAMIRDGDPVVAVASPAYLGVITDPRIAQALAEGVDLNLPCRDYAVSAPRVSPYSTGAEALRTISLEGGGFAVITDDGGRILGFVGASDLIFEPSLRRPAAIGGMATPFGVYLTTGSVSGGVSKWAVASTGAMLFLLLVGSQWASDFLLERIGFSRFPVWAWSTVASLVPLSVFLMAMRLIPLAGTHGAEHQVVHAVERGEDLVPSVVRRMPRVHPRCGTNFAAAFSIFLAVASWSLIPEQEVRLLLAVVVTAALWRPVGSWLQQHVTTKRPSDAQIQSGIRAANELLDRYQDAPLGPPKIWTRIWNSGLVQLISGSWLMFGALYGASKLIGFDLLR